MLDMECEGYFIAYSEAGFVSVTVLRMRGFLECKIILMNSIFELTLE